MSIYSAASVAALGVIYAATGAIGMAHRLPGSEPLRQVDPFLAILELLLLLVAPALVVTMAAVYRYAAPERKIHGLAALAFMIAYATVTFTTHFVSLSFGRQAATGASGNLAWLIGLNNWPSIAMAADLLAWDFLLGLSLLFAAAVFRSGRLERWTRMGLIAAGALCTAATLGPLLGRMQLQFLGIFGYAFLLPALCVLIALVFARAGQAADSALAL
jgi:hypothetical protein